MTRSEPEIIDQAPQEGAALPVASATALSRGDGTAALAQLPPATPDEQPTRYVARLMEMLPPPPDDVVEKITAQLLDAPDLASENEVWDSTSSKQLIGKLFTFHSVHILPSDQPDSLLPYYVLAKVVDMETGEQLTISSGSMSIVTSLVKAQLLGNLPAVAEIMGPRRETRNKRVPLHLRWHVNTGTR